MRILDKKSFFEIISGANLLATGGGGTISKALSITKKIKQSVQLVSLAELKRSSLVCTVFGVGGKENCDPLVASKAAMKIFQKILNKKISALIPVEAGAESFATALFIASKLNIPVLDSDIVGLRSSPEIYLETITLANLKRTPCAIADDKGNSAVLWSSQNPKKMEQFLRNFAISSGGDAFVAGYPLPVRSLKGIIPEGSITIAQQTGQALTQLKRKKITLAEFCGKMQWAILGVGRIVDIAKNDSKGFVKGKCVVRLKTKERMEVFFKNENLVILKNRKVLLTCPDSISFLDLNTCQGVNNFEENKNKRVAILGKKAIATWRTKEGKKLFNPRRLGFPYAQKLLS